LIICAVLPRTKGEIIMATQENQVFLDVELCGETATTASDPVETDIIDLEVTKTSDCEFALVGGNICYTVTITNYSDVDFITGEMGGIVIRDPLSSNLEYVPGSFYYTIDGGEPVTDDPNIDGSNVLTYTIELAAGETAVVHFCVKVLSMPV